MERIYAAATRCTSDEAKDHVDALRSPDRILKDYGVAKATVFAFNFEETSFWRGYPGRTDCWRLARAIASCGFKQDRAMAIAVA